MPSFGEKGGAVMARFTNGWVKVYRSVGEGDLVDNPLLFALWCRLLTLATWKPSKVLWGGKQREIPPGSIVFGIKEISDTWAVSRSVIQKWLRYLHDTGRIVLTANQRGTIVTICNWESYQSKEDCDAPESVHSDSTATSLRANCEALIEEEKKERKKEYIQASPLVAERKGLEEQKPVIEECYAAWLDTLAFYKAGRPQLSPQEQLEIVRATQRQGSAKAVLYALHGARYEPKSEKFNPADFLKIERILDPKNINRFLNLGIQAEHKKAGGS